MRARSEEEAIRLWRVEWVEKKTGELKSKRIMGKGKEVAYNESKRGRLMMSFIDEGVVEQELNFNYGND